MEQTAHTIRRIQCGTDNCYLVATGHLYSNLDAIRKSAERITSLGERTLHYGHGKATANRFKMV